MSFSDSWRGGGTGRGAYVLKAKNSTQVTLSVDGASGHASSDVLFRVRKSDGTVVFSVTNAGDVTFAGSGTITIDTSVTGDLTVNGDTILGSDSLDTTTINGVLNLQGSTSGVVTLQAATVTGTYTLTLPTTDGNASEFLQTNGSGVLTWSAVSSAPVDGQYVVITANATMTAERVLTGTTNQIVITDGGAGSTVTLSTPQDIHTSATPTFGGLTVTQAAGTAGAVAVTITPGAHTDVTGNVSAFSIAAQTFTIDDAATVATLSYANIAALTVNGVAGGSAETVTLLSSLTVAAPVTGTNVTVTERRVLNAAADTDVINVFGRTALSSSVDVDWATFSHFDNRTNGAKFAITTDTNGTTYVNASSTSGTGLFFATGGSGRMKLSTNGVEFTPAVDGVVQLGTASLKWGDLFLDTGGTINFNASDVIITHSANTLAFTGGTNYTFDNLITLTKATTGIAFDLNCTSTAYTTAVGLIDIVRSGALTGVDTERIIDCNIVPAFTLTEPAAGSVDFTALNIDLSSVAVTAGAGASRVTAIRIVSTADADTTPYVFELPADATDPTAGGGAATGRIPVYIGGATRYLAYY